MKHLKLIACFALTGGFLLEARDACAQNRVGGNGQQQAQQGGFGTTGQSPFGNGGQSAFGGQTQNGSAGGRLGGSTPQQQVGGQDGFVGSDSDQLRNQRQDPRQRRGARFDFTIESLNEMRESARQRNGNRNQTPSVRVKIRPLFSVAQMPASQLTAQLQTQMSKALPSTFKATQISVSGTTATIQGQVASEYDKQLAAKMLSMQPGIYQVENQLTIPSVQEGPLLVPLR